MQDNIRLLNLVLLIIMATFSPPDKFSFQAAEWKDWIASYQRFRIASKNHKEEGEIQRDSLIYAMGVKEAEKILKTFTFAEGESPTDFNCLVKKFEEHFIPVVNIRYERAKFHNRKQFDGESVEAFVRDLYSLVSTCGYNDENDQILDRVVQGLKDSRVRRKLQLENNITLTKAISIARQYEMIECQEKDRSSDDKVEINATTKTGKSKNFRSKQKSHDSSRYNKKSDDSSNKKCSRCGKEHGTQQRCPASGKTCNYCHKRGHFVVACRKRLSRKMQAIEVSDTEIERSGCWTDAVTVRDNTESWYVDIKIGKVPTRFKIDTGADITIITYASYKKLRDVPRLKPCEISISSPGGKVRARGEFMCTTEYKGRAYKFRIIVAEIPKGNNLLSRTVSETMGLVKRLDEVENNIFGTAGEMKTEPVKIKLKENAEPYCLTTARRVPFPIYEKAQKELERMEQEGIIRKVTEATDWCAPMVPVIKPNGQVRICVDFKKLNQSVMRPHLMLPNLEDIAPKLSNAKIFSTLDVASGFYQVPLDPEAALLTTFITPFDRYCFNRLPMGINLGPEEFQRKMSGLLSKTEGVDCIMDDIIVYGENQEQHDQRLKTVMNIIEKSGLKLNEEKCHFNNSEVTFFGHVVSKDGIKPSPTKIQAIQEMPPPSNVTELRTMLGMLNYLGKFINNLATIVKPMSDLLKKDTTWCWGKPQQNALKKIKGMISDLPSLTFYRSDRETVVSADASSYGLGAVIMQRVNNNLLPIAFASRTLTSSEKNYSQIEKEALASVWACEKFQKYLIGLNSFELQTDHKPLVPLMMTKDLDRAPIRCQKLLLRLMRFNAQVRHVPGKQLVIADTLSRLPLPCSENDVLLAEVIEAHLESGWNSDIDQLKRETQRDEDLQLIIQYILHGWPSKDYLPPNIHCYWPARDDMSVVNGLVTYRERIVVPEAERTSILETLHESHQGIQKCLENAKESVWWPSLKEELENLITACEECQRNKPTQRYEPLKPSELPRRPWEKLAADLCQVNNKTFLIVVDYYSRWIEIKHLKSTTSEAVIRQFRDIFTQHGYPRVLITDNGPQFVSQEFISYAREEKFKLHTSSPYFPHANGAAERAVQTAKKIIKQKKPDVALLNYRTTKHSATGVSPCVALMGRMLKTRLPVLNQKLLPRSPVDEEIRKKDSAEKQRQKEAFDKRHGVRPLKELEPGEQVRIRAGEDRTWREPGTIIQQADDSRRSYHVQTPSGVIRRNRKHLQEVPPIKMEDLPESDSPREVMSESPVLQRRSSRITRKPEHLKDFVLDGVCVRAKD